MTKRLESALRLFDENYRVYQFLFKRNNARPFRTSSTATPVVDAAIRNRVAYLAEKSDTLFSLSIYFVVLFEALRSARSLGSALLEFPQHPGTALGGTCGVVFDANTSVALDRETGRRRIRAAAKGRQLPHAGRDFVSVRLLGKAGSLSVLNAHPEFRARRNSNTRELKHDTFLDYYLCESHLECHRSHLRVDDYFVKVLTLKEPSAQTFPLHSQSGLLEVQANFHVVTEWKKEDPGKTRRTIQAKRRHFHNTKRSFISQVNLNDAAPQDVLLDDAKESQVRELGKGIEEIELHGNYFGQFSLTVVIYDRDLATVERAARGLLQSLQRA